jgi:alpha-D-ribose 1-methylphosphonate 5-triphosphate diphosphatase PhnM
MSFARFWIAVFNNMKLSFCALISSVFSLKVAMVKKLLKLASVNGHHKHVSVFSKLMPYSKYSAAESRTLSQNKTPKFWKKEQAAKKRRLC